MQCPDPVVEGPPVVNLKAVKTEPGQRVVYFKFELWLMH
jgi:hypothetical protein